MCNLHAIIFKLVLNLKLKISKFKGYQVSIEKKNYSKIDADLNKSLTRSNYLIPPRVRTSKLPSSIRTMVPRRAHL